MTCPKCQRYNPDTNEECEYCGTPLIRPSNPKPANVRPVVAQRVASQPNANTQQPYYANTQENYQSQPPREKYFYNDYKESKFTIGVVLCIALGILGFIIGLLLYPVNTYERETFMKGWLKCLVVVSITLIIVALLVVLILIGSTCSRR